MLLPQVTDLLYHQFLIDVLNTRNGATVGGFSIQKRKTFSQVAMLQMCFIGH